MTSGSPDPAETNLPADDPFRPSQPPRNSHRAANREVRAGNEQKNTAEHEGAALSGRLGGPRSGHSLTSFGGFASRLPSFLRARGSTESAENAKYVAMPSHASIRLIDPSCASAKDSKVTNTSTGYSKADGVATDGNRTQQRAQSDDDRDVEDVGTDNVCYRDVGVAASGGNGTDGEFRDRRPRSHNGEADDRGRQPQLLGESDSPAQQQFSPGRGETTGR